MSNKERLWCWATIAALAVAMVLNSAHTRFQDQEIYNLMQDVGTLKYEVKCLKTLGGCAEELDH